MTNPIWKFEHTQRWLRAYVDDVLIADSRQAMLMIESRGELDYYFPRSDVKFEFLVESPHTEFSGYRGARKFWHLVVNGRQLDSAAWTYESHQNRPDFTNYLAFQWDKISRWMEEEEEIFLHPRNPYHRVDTVASTRHVQILVNGAVVADTHRPYLLFETGLPTRYYIPQEDVQMAFLAPSATETVCPYKGRANYRSLAVNGVELEDAVWYYANPIPEAPKLKGTVAFWPEKDKQQIQILIDGAPA